MENWTASCVIPLNLVASLRGQEEFKTAYHATIICKGQEEVRRRNVAQSKATLEEILTGDPALVARRLRRVTKKGNG